MKTPLRTIAALLLSALIFTPCFADGKDLNTSQLSLSTGHALALRSDGTLWSWGTNRFGELGLGTNSIFIAPQRISSLTNIISISAGYFHSLAVQSNGSIWAWGTNGNGRLGNGTFNSSSNPVVISIITNGLSVAAGVSHSLALLSDGSVTAWGANNGGQLGIGNTQDTNRPVPINILSNMISVAAGSNFSLALTTGGDVWSWGTNNLGQLGLGDNTSRLTPVKVSTLSNIVQIAAGHGHALARDRSGNIFGWGRNTEGQIGIGNSVNTNLPVKLAGFGATNSFGSAKWIAANFNSSAAVNSSGRLYYWGQYGNGESIASVNQPAALGNASSSDQVFSTVNYGENFLLASKDDGSVWAWGVSASGQWGNGQIMDDWFYYELYNPVFSFSARPTPELTRFNRGSRLASKFHYNTFVLPLDLEEGIRLPLEGSELYCYGAETPWFQKIQKNTRQHALKPNGSSTNLIRFREDNPIVAFGSEAGGKPLYTGQRYSFGVYAGAFDERTGQTNMIRISVYDRNTLAGNVTNVAPTNVFTIPFPRRYIAAASNTWSNFITNGSRIAFETNDLRTTIEFVEGLDANTGWGLSWPFNTPANVVLAGYRITHSAASTNFYYLVEGLGSVEVGTNVMAQMSTNSSGWAYAPLYSMGFETFPEWRAHFIDHPHFEGEPLPPTYAGRGLRDLNGMLAVITNKIWITNNIAYTNLDATPELRRHPILDQFVEDMGRDPLALASYVINEIELTEPWGDIEASKMVERSVEVGGVNRSALGVFLEGQGSPTEQCALLVYLLRQAGYSAGYVFPTSANLKLLDTRLSQLWQIQVKGVVYDYGSPIITNSLITVNYPWVVLNIGTNSAHIFPWLKDTEIVEGLDIYDFMPANYFTAYDWVKDFALAKPELTALGSLNDGTANIWRRYLVNLINTNTIEPNLSLDDFGVRAFNRKNSYPSWDRLPVPNVLTNQAQISVVPTLTESAVTYPFLTNIFDRVRIEVFRANTNVANRVFDTGLLRSCDFHNRKLLLYTNAPGNLRLWMSPYRPDIARFTNFQNFETSTNSLLGQAVDASVASTVSNLPVRITYQRKGATMTSPTAWLPSGYFFKDTFPPVICKKRDVTAIIPIVGRVTPAMLRVHADDYWRQEQQRAMNPNYMPGDTNDVGTAVMMLASGFFQKLWDDDQFNQRLHKIRAIQWNSWGVAGASRLANNSMQLTLNMRWFTSQLLGNASLHPDVGDKAYSSLNNYMTMLQANASSAEHSIIHSMWGDNDSVSSVRLLQLAAERGRDNGWAQPLELNIKNYIALGNQSYTGYGGTLLKNQNPSFWQQVTNVFRGNWDSNYYRAIITPGRVASDSGGFQGMSALIFGKWNSGAIMTDNAITLNGGYSASISWAGSPSAGSSYDLSYNLIYGPSLGYDFYGSGLNYTPIYTYTYRFVHNNRVTYEPRLDFSQYDLLNLNSGSNIAKIVFTPQQVTQGNYISSALNLPGGTTTANAIKTGKNVGWYNNAGTIPQQPRAIVADPVHVVSGDFYADSVDLTLSGPMPFELRRNYLSRNLADNQIGNGWKLSIMPWLVPVTNAAGNKLIYAAEIDGAVLAYRYQSNNLWTVQPEDNPTLANFTTAGIGSIANQFNNRIEQFATNGTLYVLTAADGSKKFYQVMTSFGLNNGTNQLDRIRPYLTRWEDHGGNYYLFSYGTNSSANDFGQLNRISGANGASLILKYDVFGRIIEAITDDNRHVYYSFDNYGDLVGVKLPDDSTWTYEYDHYNFTTNGLTYTDSTHLLVREIKPNGRLLANSYDSLRRVVTQAASVGVNRELVTNAWFYYTNNCTSLTNEFLTGTTRVEDVFHNPYLYFYTNNFIARIQEPTGRTYVQDWFESSETNKSGYYQRSLELTVDYRGMTNEFRYNNQGNLTNRIFRGDLTGSGIMNESATNTFTYTSNNLPASVTDPSGNRMAYFYDDVSDSFRPTRLERWASNGTGITTNRFHYTDIAEVVQIGNTLETNQSFGLLSRVIQADTATNDWSYNGRGFVVQSVQYARTSDEPNNNDPAVATYFIFNNRGDLIQQSDPLGRGTRMNYDSAGRLQWREVFDESGSVVGRESFYYNRNGDLEWYDGPRSNPEDLIWFDYDGAGRPTQEIHWRSRAKTDGSGVEAETGDDLYATSFNRYDYFGNLVSVTDPNRAVTTNAFDALGRLTVLKVLEANGDLLTSQGFAYEPGGMVTFQTNALGGVTERQYTSAGLIKFQKNPDGSTNAWRYGLDGRVSKIFLSNGSYWQLAYDDANRSITRTFYSASGSPLATTSAFFDRRGNLVQETDAAGNSFGNSYDGLNRLKSASGPAITTVRESCGLTPGCGVYVTNVFQPVVTNFYDLAGAVFTNVNALGEKAISRFDALGRPTRSEIRGSDGSLVRESSAVYSSDFQNVTFTSGSGANAVASTIYTDNNGQVVLSTASPDSGKLEYDWNRFDSAGNRIEYRRYANFGQAAPFTIAKWTFDGLHRPVTETVLDGVVNTFGYDSGGNLTNRTMSGVLSWQARYSSANQLLEEKNVGAGGAATRTNSYTYYSTGHPWAGLLQTRTDGRGVTCTYTYNEWLRLATNTHTGSLAEQNLTTVWQYESRGMLTNAFQSFASGVTGPSSGIRRSYNEYGELNFERVQIGGVTLYDALQSWDAAGRRTFLSLGGGYAFGWRADGLLASASFDGLGGGTYSYDTAGLLTTRLVAGKMTSITRDGLGRPLSVATTVNLSSKLTETLTWTGDGLPATHTLVRSGDFTDSRQFFYADQSRRLVEERLNLDALKRWTNTYTFDNGTSAGLGVLTQIGQNSSSPQWSGATDAFSRISMETNTVTRQLAYGRINGSAKITASLDGAAQSVNVIATGDPDWPNQWRGTMDMTPGNHQLIVNAVHPSGLFTNTAVSSFTNNLGSQTIVDSIDPAGNLTQRIWKKPNGTTNLIQTLFWDGRGRLYKVTERDGTQSGRDLAIIYDALGRRLQTAEITITNGVALTNQPMVVSHYFDPEVEFLELGLKEGTKTSWKFIGPDFDGVYGGQNGTGGFDAEASGFTFSPTIGDAFGNIQALYTQGNVSWNSSRLTGYGGVPGYSPLTLGSDGTLAAKFAWRNRAPESVGFFWMGGNWFDSASGRFLSPDPFGHDASMSLYSFCWGSPYALWDADGRLAAFNQQQIANGRLPITRYGGYPTVVCHGMSASGPIPGVPLTYNFVNGHVINSGGNGRIIGNMSAGTGGGIASFPQNLGNFVINATTYPFAMMREGEYIPITQQLSQNPLKADTTAKWVRKQIYSDVDNGSMITMSGDIGGNLLAPYGYTKAFNLLRSGVTATRTVTIPEGLLEEATRLEQSWPQQMQVLKNSGQPLAMAQRVVKRPPAPYWESRPQYYISEGVRRSVAARESGVPFIRARLVRPGQPDQLIQVHLDQLHSPKPSIEPDFRFSPQLRPDYPPIEIQSLGQPGQSPTTPLLDVEIY